MEIERAKKKMIECEKFIENEAVILLRELKEDNETYGDIQQILEYMPMNDSFVFVVKKARELLQKEISTIKFE